MLTKDKDRTQTETANVFQTESKAKQEHFKLKNTF